MSAKIRCAVYTRKSTDDGLDQEFNSLDAQREACEAFIKSQRGMGWVVSAEQYDDGGLSGGTMERPALRALLAAIEKGKIDTVVVYKVDRLTRSLADFAKIVDVFDARHVSFVSVTQQFNTTTSMGRLTLNMLLSFAQFEREVTSERIRDKIAASKKKGMWMGGLPPLGYDVREKRLVVDHDEAETVRTLFRLYLELGTVKAVVDASRRLGLLTKRRQSGGSETGGKPFTRGHLYQLLANRIYVGEITHKGVAYPGQHKPVIDREIFKSVGGQLAANATARRSATNVRTPSLLVGLITDEAGDRLCPTHASKNGRHYRYYISKRLMHRTGSTDGGGWRLPAKELENAVSHAVGDFLKDRLRVIEALKLHDVGPVRLRTILEDMETIANQLEQGQSESQPELLRHLIHDVTLQAGLMRIQVKRGSLATLDTGEGPATTTASDDLVELDVPLVLRRRGVGAKLIVQSIHGGTATPDRKLIDLVSKAHHWFGQLAGGSVGSARDIARRDGVEASEITRTIQLAFLAPDIVEAILAGRQPVELTPRRLLRVGKLPLDWDQQRRVLGFAV